MAASVDCGLRPIVLPPLIGYRPWPCFNLFRPVGQPVAVQFAIEATATARRGSCCMLRLCSLRKGTSSRARNLTCMHPVQILLPLYASGGKRFKHFAHELSDRFDGDAACEGPAKGLWEGAQRSRSHPCMRSHGRSARD